MQEDGDPRATVIGMKTEDYDIIQSLTEQVLQQNPLKLQYLLEKVQQHPMLKEDSEFMHIIFQSHAQLVIQMIEWMFTPRKIIARKQLKPQKSNNCGSSSELMYLQIQNSFSQPFQCRNFIHKNYCFYEEMYRVAKDSTIPITMWFSFLINQQISDVDENQFYTSLGYFNEVMSYFVSHDYHTYVYLSLSSNIGVKEGPQSQNTVLQLFNESLIRELMELVHIPEVFQVMYKLVLSSLQQPTQKDRAMRILQKLFQSGKRMSKQDVSVHLKHEQVIVSMCVMLKEILDNICTDKPRRGDLLIQAIVKTKISQHCIEQICTSQLCMDPKQRHQQFSQQDEQERLENHLKFLTLIVTIYAKVCGATRNRLNSTSNENATDLICESAYRTSQQPKRTICEKDQIYKLLDSQVMQIIIKLPNMCQLVRQPMNRSIPFSSGQNIKPITMVKLVYFQLVLQCLQIAKDEPELVIDMDALGLFLLVQRYLVQNRWNNIAHHILQKIASILIVNNYNFFKRNNMQKSNLANGFLGYLTQTFTNKDYIFLQTFHFTTQGNLHSLYKIAKIIAYEINNNQNLIQLLDSFQPWKKFILTDLKKYQERTFDTGVAVDGELLVEIALEHTRSGKHMQVSVDEVDSIKKLISAISFKQKWPVKTSRKKKSHSGVFKSSIGSKNRLKDTQIDIEHFLSSENVFSKKKSQGQMQPTGELRMSYPPVIGRIDCAKNQQDLQNQQRIGKHFFARAKSSKQFWLTNQNQTLSTDIIKIPSLDRNM